MQQAPLKTHDLIAIGLGIIGWIFPDVSLGVKILVSAFIIAIIVYVMMSRQQKQKTLNAVGFFFEKCIIPAFTGGVYTFFGVYIIFILLNIIFGVQLLQTPTQLPLDNPAWNFNFSSTGRIVIIIAVVIGAIVNITDRAAQKRKIEQRQEVKN